jgi:hypothetical protein
VPYRGSVVLSVIIFLCRYAECRGARNSKDHKAVILPIKVMVQKFEKQMCLPNHGKLTEGKALYN